MPIHIEEMTSDVTVVDGDLPLTDQQLEKLVQLVIARIEEKQRDQLTYRESTTIRNQATPESNMHY